MATFGVHTLFRKAQRLVAKVCINATFGHFTEQAGNGFSAETFARFCRRVEKSQLDLVTLALLTQPGVDAKQQFKHRTTPHGCRLIGVAAKAQRNTSMRHVLQTLANGLSRRHPFT